MKTTPVSKLKATLSEQLARVKAGEEVVVTERGRPIGKIVLLSGETMGLSVHMSELARKGLIRLGVGKISTDIWKLPRLSDKQGRGAQALLDEREQGDEPLGYLAKASLMPAVLVWAASQTPSLEFVCPDQRLREAADREGFQVIP